MLRKKIIYNFIFIKINLFLTISSIYANTDLVDIYKLSEKSDVIIKQQHALYQATKQDKYIERGQLLPQIDLDARKGATKIDKITAPFTFHYDEYNILLQQVLFDWEKWHRYLRTNPLISIAEKTWYKENQNLILRVSQAYLDILLAQDILEFTEKEYEAIHELYKESEMRFKIGDITIADIDQVKSDLDSVTSDLYAARNEVENKREILREIINVPIPVLSKLKPNLILPILTPTSVEEWLKIAMQNNLNLQAAQANKKVADHNISIAEAGYMPTVNLSARLRGSDRGRIITFLLTPTREFVNTFRVGIDIQSPNLNPYGSIATNRKAMAEFHRTDQEYTEEYRKTHKLIEQYYREIVSTKEQITALAQSIKAAQSSLDATKASFEVGNRTYVFVLNRISDLYSAKKNYKEAIYRYIMALLKLEDTAGRLTLKELIAVNQMLDKKVNSTHIPNKTAKIVTKN